MRSSECPKIGIGRLNITGSVVKLESTRLGFFVSGFQDRSPDLRISRDSGIQRFHGCVFSRRWRVLERPRWCHIRQEVSDHTPLSLLTYHLASLSRSSTPGVFSCQLKKRSDIFFGVSDLNLYSYMKGKSEARW